MSSLNSNTTAPASPRLAPPANGSLAEASCRLDEALRHEETSPLWNEWALVCTTQNRLREAEEGFCRALELDPHNADAAANLGALLAKQGRRSEAIPFLEMSAERLEGPERDGIARLLAECRGSRAFLTEIAPGELEQLLRRVAHLFEGGEEFMREAYQCLLPFFSQGQRVLDLGCGRGTFLEELAKRGVEGIGVEVDPERVAESEAKGLRVFRLHIREFMANFHERVDGVCLMHVIEHIDGEDALGLLAQCCRLLNPGGKLILVTPNFAHGMVSMDNFWVDITHKRPYPLRLLKGMVSVLGMNVIEARVSPWNEIDLLVVGSKPQTMTSS